MFPTTQRDNSVLSPPSMGSKAGYFSLSNIISTMPPLLPANASRHTVETVGRWRPSAATRGLNFSYTSGRATCVPVTVKVEGQYVTSLAANERVCECLVTLTLRFNLPRGFDFLFNSKVCSSSSSLLRSTFNVASPTKGSLRTEKLSRVSVYLSYTSASNSSSSASDPTAKCVRSPNSQLKDVDFGKSRRKNDALPVTESSAEVPTRQPDVQETPCTVIFTKGCMSGAFTRAFTVL
mmetsp:Transcript_36437/g.96936  ORF Transcript_36437/g.96936 Transcript_36437/m.96936 type:complete len:236 (+) Transcript_36437:512-1219(+)